MDTGKLIVFEGGEGCGKSTQQKLLAQWLRFQGIEPVITQEPGGTARCKPLRKMLLETEAHPNPIFELLLYIADRVDHFQEVIKPALAAGKIILCDRYIHSTIAYQGYGRGMDLGLINSLNSEATNGRDADLVFWLDIKPEEGLKRKHKLDEIEQRSLTFHDAVYRGYKELHNENTNIISIDARKDKKTISSEIVTYLSKELRNGSKY
jgi:dTMP kinase